MGTDYSSRSFVARPREGRTPGRRGEYWRSPSMLRSREEGAVRMGGANVASKLLKIGRLEAQIALRTRWLALADMP